KLRPPAAAMSRVAVATSPAVPASMVKYFWMRPMAITYSRKSIESNIQPSVAAASDLHCAAVTSRNVAAGVAAAMPAVAPCTEGLLARPEPAERAGCEQRVNQRVQRIGDR